MGRQVPLYSRQLLADQSLDLIDAKLRFHCVPDTSLETRPLVLQGLRMFRKKHAPCRCVVPWDLPDAHAAIDEGLRAAQKFLQQTLTELRDYVGSVGVNYEMREVMRNARPSS